MNIEAQVAKARDFCANNGARFTHLREKVYTILLEQEGCMGAYELLDILKLTEASAKPATVYRALDFLLMQGLIHRVESNNTFVTCNHFDCGHPVQFLICDACGYVKEIQSSGLKKTLDQQAESHGFLVSKQTIEAHGTCANCQ